MVTETDKLINLYQNSQQSMINIIAQREAKGTTTQYQKALLGQINAELNTLTKEATKWADRAIPKEYKTGVSQAQEGLLKLGVEDVSGYSAFAKLHTKQVELLVNLILR